MFLHFVPPELSPITCYMNSCDLLTPDLGWEAGVVNTLHSRRFHSSSVTVQGLLLIGGDDSPETSELLAWGTNQSIPSVVLPSPGRSRHCSIQISEDIFILTGGSLPQTSNLVTELSNLGSNWQVSNQPISSSSLLAPTGALHVMYYCRSGGRKRKNKTLISFSQYPGSFHHLQLVDGNMRVGCTQVWKGTSGDLLLSFCPFWVLYEGYTR